MVYSTPWDRSRAPLRFPWDAVLFSAKLMHFQQLTANLSENRGEMAVFFISRPLVLKMQVWPKNKTATCGKRKGTLEPSQQVEQLIPRGQHPHRPLFGRKTTEKGKGFTFQQAFFNLYIKSGLIRRVVINLRPTNMAVNRCPLWIIPIHAGREKYVTREEVTCHT